MSKFHNGPKGPGRCTAGSGEGARGCPFGGDDVHYASKAEAQVAFEKKLEEEYGNLPYAGNKKDLTVPLSDGDIAIKYLNASKELIEPSKDSDNYDEELYEYYKAQEKHIVNFCDELKEKYLSELDESEREHVYEILYISINEDDDNFGYFEAEEFCAKSAKFGSIIYDSDY